MWIVDTSKMVDILDIYRVVCGHCTEAAPQTNFVSKLVYQEAAAGGSLGWARLLMFMEPAAQSA